MYKQGMKLVDGEKKRGEGLRGIDTVIEWSPFAGHQICGRSNIVVMANSPIRSEGENIYIIIGVMRMPLIKETWLRG